jgi:hypothetical protein
LRSSQDFAEASNRFFVHYNSAQMFPAGTDDVVREALRALGVRNLVLGIHDPAFPGVPGDDAGRGSPYSQGGQRFFEFAAALGFSGVPGIPSKLWHGTSTDPITPPRSP